MSDHAMMLAEMNRLVPQFDSLRKVSVEMAEVAVALGHQINLLSTLVETPPDDATRDTLLDKAPFFLKYEMSPAMREWVEWLVASLRAGNGVAVEKATLAPVEQWPQIGNTVEIGFVVRNDQLTLRAVVEIPCHEHTSESAEGDFLTLHPRAEGVRTTFAEWPSANTAEMAVYAPSEIPPYLAPYLKKSSARAAEFAPDYEPHSSPERAEFEVEAAEDAIAFAADDSGSRSYGTTHRAPTPPNIPEGAIMATSSDLDKPLPHLGGRKKTDMTAQEWALSAHFLAYMKTPPFNGWPADKQTTARDAFVAAVAPNDRMNRWGRRFAKFCGVP